jgi:hypothetical protein
MFRQKSASDEETGIGVGIGERADVASSIPSWWERTASRAAAIYV